MTAAPIPDSYWLIDGLLLAGEYPGAWDEDRARERLSAFLDAGIRTFINLTETREPLNGYEDILRELAAARGIAARHVPCAIPDRGVPADRESIVRILATIREEITASRPVYLHCWGGIGRTGTVAGCWLVEEGLTGADAIARIAELRRDMPDGRFRSPETDEQCEFIREWSA